MKRHSSAGRGVLAALPVSGAVSSLYPGTAIGAIPGFQDSEGKKAYFKKGLISHAISYHKKQGPVYFLTGPCRILYRAQSLICLYVLLDESYSFSNMILKSFFSICRQIQRHLLPCGCRYDIVRFLRSFRIRSRCPVLFQFLSLRRHGRERFRVL